MRTLLLACALLSPVLPASAQDRTWNVDHRVGIDADHVVIDVPATDDGAPTRVRVHGTIDSTLDGSELDALTLRRGGGDDLATGAPLLLSEGAHVVDADALAHRYVIEAPPGTPIHASLAIARMAATHLVTATELRASLRGALEVDVLRRTEVATFSVVNVPPTESSGPLAVLLAGVLGAIGFVFLRKREPEEARLLRRARRAREAIATRARALGPGLAGVIAPAERLEAAIRRAREHITTIERAIAATRWTEGEAARTHVRSLEQRRDAVRSDLARMTGELEAALVRLTSLETERHADTEGDAIAARVRAEVELAEDVEREVARL